MMKLCEGAMENDERSALFEQANAALSKLSEARGGGKEDGVQRMWVPGRIELVGKHTDYAKGKSLVCAVDKGLAISFSLRNDGLVRLYSCDMGGEALEYDLSMLDTSLFLPANRKGWAKYVSGALQFVTHVKHWDLGGGLDLTVKSNLPPNSGLSSSSALVCAVAAALTKAAGKPEGTLSVDELGKIESGDLVGTRGGSQDHAAIMFGQENSLCLLSYANGTELLKRIPFPESWALVVGVSGVEACKTGNALEKYNRLATSSDAEKHKRASAESSLAVPLACQGFEQCNAQVLGAAVLLSQRHAETQLQTTVPETEFLPAAALKIPGAIGATTFGAGFGGAVVAIIDASVIDPALFCQQWQQAYNLRYPHRAPSAHFFTTKPSAGFTFV